MNDDAAVRLDVCVTAAGVEVVLVYPQPFGDARS
jgi:hypothetical protein